MPSTRSKSTPSDTASSNTMKTTKKKSNAMNEDAAAKERARQYYEKLLLKQEQMKQKKSTADFKKATMATGSVSSSASTKPRQQQQYPKRTTTHGATKYAPKSSNTGKTPRTMMEKVYQDMLKLEEKEAAEEAAAAAAEQEKYPTWSSTSWANPFMTSTRRGAAASSSTSNGTTPMNWGPPTWAAATAGSAAPLFPNFMKSPTTTPDTNTFMSSLSSSSSEAPFVPQYTYQQPRQRPTQHHQVRSTMSKTAPSSQKQKISQPTYNHHYENKKMIGTSPWWYRPLNTIIDVFVCLILYTLEMKYHLWSTIGMLLIRWIISGVWKCITYPIRQQQQQSNGDTTGSSIISSLGYMLFHAFTILLILGVGCMLIVSRFNNNKNNNVQEDEDDVDESVQSDVDELQNMVYDELITIQQQHEQDTNISIHTLQDRIFSQLFTSVGSDEDTDYHRKNNQYWINTVWPRVLGQLLYCNPNVIVSHGVVVGTENDTGNTTFLRWNGNNDHGADGSIPCNKKRKQ